MIRPDSLLDTAKLGNKMNLTGISPAYAYKIIGYKYEAAAAALGHDKLRVRIDGARRIEIKEGLLSYVAFDGIQLCMYVRNGKSCEHLCQAKTLDRLVLIFIIGMY